MTCSKTCSNVVFLNVQVKSYSPSSNILGKVISNLPAGFRPSEKVNGTLLFYSNGEFKIGHISLSEEGVLKTSILSSIDTMGYCTVTYIAKK